jgi:PhnB protein
MCPGCIASAALLWAGAASAGGVVALLAKKVRPKSRAPDDGPRATTAAKAGDQHDAFEPRLALSTSSTKGMKTMQLITYLNFNGTCAEAFKFYQKVLEGELIAMFTHGESPMADQAPPELRDKVMHAALKVGDAMIMGSDAMGEMFNRPQGFAVSIMIDDVARGERIFAALAEGGTVRMALDKTFWAERFGDLVDRFGIPWMVSAGQLTQG